MFSTFKTKNELLQTSKHNKPDSLQFLQRGLYQNNVTSSLAAIQRSGQWADNCKNGLFCYQTISRKKKYIYIYMRKKLRNAPPCKKRAISLLARYTFSWTFSHFDSPITASVHYKLLHKNRARRLPWCNSMAEQEQGGFLSILMRVKLSLKCQSTLTLCIIFGD